jgi:cytochrome P450
LLSCQYLKACIDEALRLAPAAPGALWREACEGGAFIDGEFIPEGLDAGTCTYALSHSAEYFEEPFKFMPERFIDRSPANNFDAYAPFSIGPRSCLAKPLAYLELTLALAHIIWRMDFEVVSSLGEGGSNMGRGRERREEFQITDMFSSNKQGPVLKFRRRF